MSENLSAQLLIEASRITEDRVRPVAEGVSRNSGRIDENNAANLRLATKLDSLEKQLALPFYKDQKFWAGLLAFPCLFLAGWLLRFASNDSSAFRIIHKALGTEPALEIAMNDTKATLRETVKSSLADFFIGKTELSDFVDEELGSQLAVRYMTLHRVGLVHPENVRPCEITAKAQIDSECLSYIGAINDTETSIFAMSPGKLVNFTLAVNFSELDRESQVAEDVTDKFPFDDVLKIEIDGVDVTGKIEKQISRYDAIIDGSSLSMRPFIIRNYELADLGRTQEFPMHSATVEFRAEAPRNIIGTVILAVTQPPSPTQTN